MRFLVTGGAGFIGSHVVEQLLRRGDDVTVIDDLNDFYSPKSKRENLTALHNAGDFRFHQCDINDTDRAFQITVENRPEVLIHLAARAGVRPSLEQPLLYERANVQGTITLLEASRKLGVRQFIFASSSSVYGVASAVPFTEDDHLNLPISPYAATKIAGEKMCYAYSHLYAIQVICLRFFTVYGPRQRPDLAISRFTNMIDHGKPIPVFGDGLTGRDYTYISDIVQGILAASSYKCAYEIFNLGSAHPVRLHEMIRLIEEALGKRAIIQRLPDQPGDVPITYADISKAQRLLGYNPSTPFPEGIQRFVAWYRENSQLTSLAMQS
jgi:UDP-glucuronate 4-epimerase